MGPFLFLKQCISAINRLFKRVKNTLTKAHSIRRIARSFQQQCCEENPSRGMAQPGSASALGAEGRRFKSCCPDHLFHVMIR